MVASSCGVLAAPHATSAHRTARAVVLRTANAAATSDRAAVSEPSSRHGSSARIRTWHTAPARATTSPAARTAPREAVDAESAAAWALRASATTPRRDWLVVTRAAYLF